jgi:hypothetical protein
MIVLGVCCRGILAAYWWEHHGDMVLHTTQFLQNQELYIICADGGKSTVRQYVTDQLPTYADFTLRSEGPREPRTHVTDPPFGVTSVNGYTYKTMGFLCPGPPDSADRPQSSGIAAFT